MRSRPKQSVSRTAAVGLISMAVGLVSLWCSKAYYVGVFLPRYHGSVLDAAKQLIDSDGWWAYFRSGPGMALNGLGVTSLLVSMGCFWSVWRR